MGTVRTLACAFQLFADMLLWRTIFYLLARRQPRPTLFPYTTLFRSLAAAVPVAVGNTRREEDQRTRWRSEEHTSELQSQSNIVCRLLLEKKKSQSLNLAPLRNCFNVRCGIRLLFSGARTRHRVPISA